jgi:hypothetical protein
MKLTKEKIQHIETYLDKNGITYLDLRMELLDHFVLAIEDEMSHQKVIFEEALQKVNLSFGNKIESKYVLDKKQWEWNLEKGKRSNEGFDKLIKEKKKQIHWSQQRQLLKMTVSFVTETPKIIIAVGVILCIYFAAITFESKTIELMLIFTIIIPQMAEFFFQFKKYKKMISGENVLSIMALPSLFLYTFLVVDDILLENQWLLMGYWILALLFNVSGLLTLSKIRKQLISEYKILTA